MTKPTGNPKGRPPGKTYPAKFIASLTQSQRDRLLAYAEARNVSGSEAVRRALERLFND